MMHWKYGVTGLAALLVLAQTGQAEELEGSGVDWQNSTMQVEFTPESAFVPASTCFATTTPTSCGVNCFIEDLDTLGYSDETPDPIVDGCFKEAGDYETNVVLVDFAGNLSTPETANFTIFPGTPDEDASTVTLTNCDSGDTAPVANGSDTCTVTLAIRDEYGNPVTQLNNYASAQIYSDNTYPLDANSGLSYRDSIEFNSTGLGTSGAPTTFTVGSTDEVTASFLMTALAPSITSVDGVLGLNETFRLDLGIELPGIDSAGAIDVSNPVIFEFNQYSPSIRFRPIYRAPITLPSNTEFIIDVPNQMDIASVLQGTGQPDVEVGIRHHFLPGDLDFTTQDVDNPGVDPDLTPAGYLYLNDNLAFETPVYTGGSIDVGSVVSAVIAPSGIASFTDNLSFSSLIRYTIGGNTIEYPGGAIGSGFNATALDADDYLDTQIGVRLIGASIEGSVLGDATDTKFADDVSSLLGENVFEDVREQIFENAYRVTRGLAAKGTTTTEFDLSWFASDDIAVVDGDVTIGTSSAITLPSGANTLVVRNGNLIVGNDVVYNAASPLDSFGFILINDTVGAFPEKGNIMMRPNVKRFSGTVFAEGTFMSNTAAIPTIYNNDNGNTSNRNQLLFEGTLLTHNTLGGGYPALLPAGTTNYVTPWGTTDSLQANGELNLSSGPWSGTSEIGVARAYDLHLVRYFRGSILDPGGCQASGCDSNENAMIIRYDGRAGKVSPPGFEQATFLKR